MPTVNDRLAVFTTGSRNRMGMARALMATVQHWYPEADTFICVGDDAEGLLAPGSQVVAGDAIGVPDWRRVSFAYDAMALNCLLKPFMFLHLAETLGYGRVMHFDTDMALYDRLHGADAALDAGAALVLTPHLLAPPAAGDVPGPHGILMAGTYNTGFVAAGATPDGLAALRWWAERLHEDAGIAPERGQVWDQRCMDLVPGLFPAVAILRDPAVNVAYWNLPQRTLGRDAQGWTVDGQRLGLFHFSGFNPADPTRLTRHACSLPHPPPEPLPALLADYAARVAGREEDGDLRPYAYGRFASGTPIPAAARNLFQERHRDWPGDPFATFETYLNATAPNTAVHASGLRVTNLIGWMVAADPLARLLLPLGLPEGVAQAVRWAAASGLAADFLAAASPGAEAAALAAEPLALDDPTALLLPARQQRVLEFSQRADLAERELAAMRQSTSWRLTAPVRGLAGLLRR